MKTPGAVPAKPKTVLVVEDQGAVRDLIEKTLRRFGYAVIIAGTTSQASTAARRHSGPIDVMLTDVVLQDGNGREAARRVLAIRPSMRVLYMSGYTAEAIVHHGVLDEVLAFMQKPFTAEQIVHKIRAVLDAELPPAG